MRRSPFRKLRASSKERREPDRSVLSPTVPDPGAEARIAETRRLATPVSDSTASEACWAASRVRPAQYRVKGPLARQNDFSTRTLDEGMMVSSQRRAEHVTIGGLRACPPADGVGKQIITTEKARRVVAHRLRNCRTPATSISQNDVSARLISNWHRFRSYVLRRCSQSPLPP